MMLMKVLTSTQVGVCALLMEPKGMREEESRCLGLRNTPCPHCSGTSLFHTVRAGDEHGALAQKEEGTIVFYFWVKAGLISITKRRVSQIAARRTSY